MTFSQELPVIRAVNFARREHVQTYVALRELMAGFRNPEDCFSWAESFCRRRAITQYPMSYLETASLKKINNKGGAEYRKLKIPSPTAMLSEAWLLYRYSLNAKNYTAAYSYRWPRPGSGQAYEHFMSGFSLRNKSITEMCKKDPTQVVFVSDVENFYPSIPVHRLRDKVSAFNKNVLASSDALESAEFCLSQTVGASSDGLWIGPPISHFYANVYLDDVDVSISSRYPNKYFRYVDDIAVVCDSKDISDVSSLCDSVFQEQGLKLSEGKSFRVSARSWILRQNLLDGRRDEDSMFVELLDTIAVYFLRYPGSYDQIRTFLRDAGFSLPVERVHALSQYNFYQRMIYSLMGSYRAAGKRQGHQGFRNAKKIYSIFSASEGDIVAQAQKCRLVFQRRAEALAESSLPAGGMERKWFAQDARFIFTRLLYLCPINTYDVIGALIPDIPELFEVRLVYRIMSSGLKSGDVIYPGAVSRTIGELFRENSMKVSDLWQYCGGDSITFRENASALSIYGAVAQLGTQFDFLAPADKAYVAAFRGESLGFRSLKDFSYVDEVESLRMRASSDGFDGYLRTRFTVREGSFLEAMLLDSENYED